eukprot:Colp12_sorted_trinity150504_noHs@21362
MGSNVVDFEQFKEKAFADPPFTVEDAIRKCLELEEMILFPLAERYPHEARRRSEQLTQAHLKQFLEQLKQQALHVLPLLEDAAVIEWLAGTWKETYITFLWLGAFARPREGAKDSYRNQDPHAMRSLPQALEYWADEILPLFDHVLDRLSDNSNIMRASANILPSLMSLAARKVPEEVLTKIQDDLLPMCGIPVPPLRLQKQDEKWRLLYTQEFEPNVSIEIQYSDENNNGPSVLLSKEIVNMSEKMRNILNLYGVKAQSAPLVVRIVSQTSPSKDNASIVANTLPVLHQLCVAIANEWEPNMDEDQDIWDSDDENISNQNQYWVTRILNGLLSQLPEGISDQEIVFEALSLASSLSLNEPIIGTLTCWVALQIKGRTPEEIRARFNITNDFTPEEEEQVRRENEWAEDW